MAAVGGIQELRHIAPLLKTPAGFFHDLRAAAPAFLEGAEMLDRRGGACPPMSR
jgi:hypothetical protein